MVAVSNLGVVCGGVAAWTVGGGASVNVNDELWVAAVGLDLGDVFAVARRSSRWVNLMRAWTVVVN